MALGVSNRIGKALKHLELSLALYAEKKKDDELPFLTVSKSLEVLMEYCWKTMKHRVEEEGLMAPTPKEAIRQAAVAGLIDRPQDWLKVLAARNDSVHDYFSISEKEYVRLAQLLVKLVRGADFLASKDSSA